ncbi:thiolase family protein [Saccharococcus caldoxylosilyticus]|jgi:3-oxoadipyl-CoA thiolase|uniref:acetyl-CoA C-acyltransferase n=2 Tax=Saccharococcus caldoxylosilyticus TaxID=81408 RepID=A0A023DG57_9BACL|nr:3-oxoadipyl-CoA thiolase [Parageobacillus caldoxylosilyticus]OQP03298.1 beta-ketoadipyl CoA thiolase [Geobacillus sp. 44B]KYD14505.1 3-ketoacyl-CoA thiolase [Parageobacillus caldoxylosilyticus]MBB3853041.1 3-oxo-5,6-didehydrosuberyl-CoA/3-oxoadipyl-CoA thiolase [Parageobacillus caldoxylosilyticus]QNU36784.1 acetyl-CoA C-acyltransferase [Geobacillus sp. 44B]QXJ39998.1 Beta-ketoadipyl-CoA thiolase [Parageobacillus caldoxylosilyticus]
MLREVVIVDAVRTPIGRYKGALKDVRPDDLAATVIRALVERNPSLPVEQIEDVVFGNANQAGEDNRNVARMAALLAGLPIEVAGTTVNRLCGSGLDAVNYAARAIMTGEAEIMIAGGTESMTRAPFVMAKPSSDFPRGNIEMFDTTIGWRFINPKIEEMYGTDSMPQTAENVAKRFGITRKEQDEFAYESQMKAKKAIETNRFADELVPVVYYDRKGNRVVVDKDEHPRPDTTLEKLAKLPPLFENGTVTAGNASGVNDGAAALLLVSAEKAKELGLKPLVKYVTSAVAGVEPAVMGIGPVFATRKALRRAGLTIDDIGLVELNEAFASQSIECIRQLELDRAKVNVNGGAIALGHPLGASGARILTTLIYEMKKRGVKYGLATMCIGVGQGIATIVENTEE